MERFPLIWTIVLNFNARELTRQCLQSLQNAAYPNLKVLLVDNASSDHTVEMAQTDFPQVAIIKNRKNYLFARGNNIGIQHALDSGAEYIFILNNDTTVDAQCLNRLAAFLAEHPKCAACQPILLQMQPPDQVASAGCRVALSGRAKDLYNRRNLKTIGPEPFQVCGVTGGALLVRSDCLRQVGAFCEYFRMYFEDVDLSLRLQEHGWPLYCVPTAKVWHYVSASTQKRGVFFHTFYTERNSYLVVLRNYPLMQIMRSYMLKVPAAGMSIGANLLKGNFAYCLAAFLAMGHGLMAMPILLAERTWAFLRGEKRGFPFWPFIEKNTLYP